MNWMEELFGVKKPIIAMCHLQPLPGDPHYNKEKGMDYVLECARRDLHALQNGGVDGIMFSNEFSLPYLTKVEPITIAAMGWVSDEDLKKIAEYSFKINQLLSAYLKDLNIELIDFKLEFGKTQDGQLVLADEISPDTCRFWDSTTHEKLDKDRFRRDLGGVEDAYQEIMQRLMGE